MMILVHVSCVGCMYIIACNYHAGNKSNSNGEKREHEQDGIGWPDRIPKTQPAWDAAQRDRAPTITLCKYHLFFLGGRNANPMTPPKHILDIRVMTQHTSLSGTHVSKKITSTNSTHQRHGLRPPRRRPHGWHPTHQYHQHRMHLPFCFGI